MSSRSVFVRWAVDISQWKPSLHDINFATSCVQPEEKERLIKFHFREDFDASLVGRLLMRKFIKDFTGIPYEKIKLSRDSLGKPILGNQLQRQDIDFNVSHHGSFTVLIGVLQDQPLVDKIKVGVDVMKIEYSGGKPLSEFFRLMNRNFSDSEWKFIKSFHTETDQTKAFMRNWCLKESYVKNIGVGITIDLQKISFQMNEKELTSKSVVDTTTLKVDEIPLNNWSFEEHLLNENHCAAVSIKNNPKDYKPEKFMFLTVNDLLTNAVPLQNSDEDYSKKVACKEFKKQNH